MKLRKLVLTTLPMLLKQMQVGETCLAPDECTIASARVTCSRLKKEGFQFLTTCKSGDLTITRLK